MVYYLVESQLQNYWKCRFILSVDCFNFAGIFLFVLFIFHLIFVQHEPEKCHVSGYDNASLLGMHHRTCESFLAAYRFSMFFRNVLCFDVYGWLNDLYVNFDSLNFHVKFERNIPILEDEFIFFFLENICVRFLYSRGAIWQKSLHLRHKTCFMLKVHC